MAKKNTKHNTHNGRKKKSDFDKQIKKLIKPGKKKVVRKKAKKG